MLSHVLKLQSCQKNRHLKHYTASELCSKCCAVGVPSLESVALNPKLLKAAASAQGWSVHVSITLVDITVSVPLSRHHDHHPPFREIL